VCSLLAPEARAPGESLLVTTSPFFSSSKVSCRPIVSAAARSPADL
jgi:hypothetical protein